MTSVSSFTLSVNPECVITTFCLYIMVQSTIIHDTSSHISSPSFTSQYRQTPKHENTSRQFSELFPVNPSLGLLNPPSGTSKDVSLIIYTYGTLPSHELHRLSVAPSVI